MKPAKQSLKWLTLLSSASAAALAYGMPAHATPDEPTEFVDAPVAHLANQSVVNDQRQSGANEGGVHTVVKRTDIITRVKNGPIFDAAIDQTDNTVAAEATGLTAQNELTSDAVAIEGNEVSALDGVVTFSDVTLAKGYSTLLSQQIIENNVEADVAKRTRIIVDARNDLVDSSLMVDNNTVSAVAASGTVSNALTQSADTQMSAGASAILYSKQSAGKFADTLASIDEVEIFAFADDTENATISISDNTVLADATALSADNQLTVEAGSIEGNDASEWDGTASYEDFAITKGFSTLVSEQTVEDKTGAEITDDVKIEANIDYYAKAQDYDFSRSSVTLGGNTVAATASAAEATNSLSQSADTVMASGASASLSSRQAILNERGAETYAKLHNADLNIYIDGDSEGSAASMSGNTVQADARGLTARNTLSVEAGSIEGNQLFMDGYVAIGDLTIAKGTSSLVSDQFIDDTVTAEVGEADIELFVWEDVESDDGQGGSSLKVEQNLIEAAATAGSVRNVLNQTADTGMSGAASAILSSKQEMTGNASTSSKVNSPDLTIRVSDDVKDVASSLSVADNTVQAVTTGLSSSNAMDIAAGTQIDGNGAATLATLNGASFSTVDYSVHNYQSVEAETLDAFVDHPQTRVTVGNDLKEASSVDVTGNLVRALVTGAVASNDAALEAGSSEGTGIAAANQQYVASSLSATVDDSEFYVTIGDDVRDQSSVDVSSNAVVAAATAASATNTVSVDAATTLSGGEGIGAVVLASGNELTGYFDGFGAGAATLLNAQVSSGSVSSDIDDVEIYLSVEDVVEGALRVEDNTVLAQSRGNVASNAVSLEAGTSIAPSAQGILASSQNRSGAINARIDEGDLYVENDTSKGDHDPSLIDGFAGAENNLVRASAAANTVLNTMAVNAGTTAGASSGAVLNADTGTGLLVTNAQYTVLNAQNNDASVSSDIADFDMRVTGGRLAGAVSLQGNTVLADASGNSAYNSLTITSGIDSYGTASVMNVQTNTSDISASVKGVDMVVRVGAPYQGASGSYSNSGNTIAATAVGNSATTTLSRTR